MNTSIFNLKSTNSAFSQRQRDIFDQLRILENNRKNLGSNNDEAMETSQAPKIKSQRTVTKHFRGKESIFKQPQDRAPRNFIRNIPDFKKHPHKWTKYSLSDVKDEDISERGNTKAALSFLNELKQRREFEIQNESDEESKKIIFNRPKSHSITIKCDKEELKPNFQSSKVVMPEYVVGQRVKKQKSRNKEGIKEKKKNELKLDHLLENEDE